MSLFTVDDGITVDENGVVFATTDVPDAQSTFVGGLCLASTGALHISTVLNASDFYNGGRRFNVNGALVVGTGAVAERPYFANNGLPFRKNDNGLVGQYNQIPNSNDPFVHGIRVGPLGGVYFAIADDTPAIDSNFLSGSLPASWTFTRSTVATYFDVAGVMQTAAINTPRFDYDPVTHQLKGLLIEPTVANRFLNSDVPVNQNITTTAVVHTLSFYGTGTVDLTGSFVGTLVGTGAYPTRTQLTFTPTAGTLSLALTGDVQKVQVELYTFATSYIPAGGAITARNQDTCRVLGAPFTAAYNAAQGTMFGQILSASPIASSSMGAALGDQATSGRQLGFFMTSNSNGMQLTDTGTALTLINPGSSALANTVVKTAGGYLNGGTKRGSCQGSTVVNNAAGAPPAVVDSFGLNPGGSTNSSVYWYQRFMYWNILLPDSELQALTL